MDQGSKFMTIISVVIIGIILQIFLGLADSKDTPTRTVTEFAKAYYNLDPSMGDYLCNAFGDADVNLVQTFINSRADQARTLGFIPNYMRMWLYAAHTRIVSLSDDEAVVHFTAKGRRNITPIFTIVGRLFQLGETHEIDATINVIKENGKWKVCGQAFALSV